MKIIQKYLLEHSGNGDVGCRIMMSRRFKILANSWGTVIVLCLAPLHANAEKHFVDVPQCPASFVVQQKITSASDGWRPVDTDDKYSIHFVSFLVGDPEGSAPVFLRASEEKQISRGPDSDVKVAFFDNLYPDKKKGSLPRWMICNYVGAEAMLAWKLPENVVRCEVVHTGLPLPDVAVRCFDAPRKKGKVVRP